MTGVWRETIGNNGSRICNSRSSFSAVTAAPRIETKYACRYRWKVLGVAGKPDHVNKSPGIDYFQMITCFISRLKYQVQEL